MILGEGSDQFCLVVALVGHRAEYLGRFVFIESVKILLGSRECVFNAYAIPATTKMNLSSQHGAGEEVNNMFGR